MRLYPPAYSFGREALEDDEILGWPVAAGTTVFVFPWVLHRDARFYSDRSASTPTAGPPISSAHSRASPTSRSAPDRGCASGGSSRGWSWL